MLRDSSCNKYIKDLSGEIYHGKIDVNKINSIFGILAKYNYSKVIYLFNVINKLHPNEYILDNHRLLEVKNNVAT